MGNFPCSFMLCSFVLVLCFLLLLLLLMKCRDSLCEKHFVRCSSNYILIIPLKQQRSFYASCFFYVMLCWSVIIRLGNKQLNCLGKVILMLCELENSLNLMHSIITSCCCCWWKKAIFSSLEDPDILRPKLLYNKAQAIISFLHKTVYLCPPPLKHSIMMLIAFTLLPIYTYHNFLIYVAYP